MPSLKNGLFLSIALVFGGCSTIDRMLEPFPDSVFKKHDQSNSANTAPQSMPSVSSDAPQVVSPVGSRNDTGVISQDGTNTSDSSLYFYKLGSGDKISIAIYGEEAISGEYVVNGEGKIPMPLIGEVYAKGLTISQLQDVISNSYAKGFIKNPSVSAQVITYRSFYILGEVVKPGMFSFSTGLVVDNAVALAGGYTYRADKRKVFIRHENQTNEIEVLQGQNVLVQPGDVIRVAERYF